MKPGDYVTVAMYGDGRICAIPVRVGVIAPKGFMSPAAMFARSFENEGKNWIRGTHPADSEKIRALKAAYALCGGDFVDIIY